jgi:two-component system phosphate regulon sensor histidine kinase PhoR
MPAGRLPGAALLAGGVPALVVLALMLAGAVAPLPGLLLLATALLAALLAAAAWRAQLHRLAAALAEEAPAFPADAAGIEDAIHRVARRQREAEGLVLRLRRADAAIVEALPDPLVVLDGNGQRLRANAAARRLFGPEEGGDLSALLRHPVLAEALDAAASDAAPRQVELSLPVPVRRDLLAHVIPMEPPLGDGGRIVLVMADLTRGSAVERMRADFVANASHELRTPLASVIGFIETLRGPARDDAEAQQRFLGIMAEQAERMRRLIDALLGLSRIEVTEHQPPAGEVDLGQLAAREAVGMAPILASRKARLETALPDGLLAAPADAEQLAQVVRNLLENAVRYGPEGGTIRLEVAPAFPDPRWPPRPGVLLSVTDEGPGIAKHHIPRLTERFYRVDRGRARHAGGTGLGLAIVKHVVKRHRGELVIESEEGAGSTFRVWLPAG